MDFLRRLFGGGPARLPATATLGDMLDHLEAEREAAEDRFWQQYRACPACESDYLRVGAWAKGDSAGWTVTCVNCGHLLEETIALKRG